MFLVTQQEFENLMFQYGTSRWGGTRKLPRVFTEHGIAMLSSVLRSKRAIQVNIVIMRTFGKLREVLMAHKDLALKVKELEHAVGRHDEAIQNIFAAIRQLMAPPPDPPKRKIGFLAD
jgi:hypothetical protein